MPLAVGDLVARAHRPRRCMARGARQQRRICCGHAGRCLYVAGLTSGSNMTDAPIPKKPRQLRSGSVPDHPVARRCAGALRGRAVSARHCRASSGRLPMRLVCALADDVVAPIDVPPFDRSNVDGFAVRSADLASAGEATPVRFMLNDEIIACGTAPTRPVCRERRPRLRPAGPLPRGADAVVMVEHTQPARQARDRDPPRRLARDNSCPMPAPTSRAARRCCAPAP